MESRTCSTFVEILQAILHRLEACFQQFLFSGNVDGSVTRTARNIAANITRSGCPFKL